MSTDNNYDLQYNIYSAASSFTSKARRKFEEDQIRALGAKVSINVYSRKNYQWLLVPFQPPKSEYVPYPHYQMVAKAKREKEKLFAEKVS